MNKFSLTIAIAVWVAGTATIGSLPASASVPPTTGANSGVSNPNSFPPPLSPLRPEQKAPLPPDTPGCYRSVHGGAWRAVDCDSVAFVSQHIPHPEIEPGPFEASSFHVPFVASTVREILANVGPENDTKFGADNYSIQDNVNFVGNNGQEDTVQFTDQAQPWGDLEAWFNQIYENNICVWQVDDPQQNYNSTCFTLLAPYLDMVQGFTRDNGTLETGVPYENGWIAVVASDQYGLEGGDRWNNSTGSLIGYGNGSQAVFAGGEIELNTTVDATTCLNADSFWIEPFPTPCTSAQYITNKVGPGPGQALTSYAPGPLTNNWGTAETNNLFRVNAPALTGEWYNNKWNTEMSYTSTTTGHCWSGSLPFCGI